MEGELAMAERLTLSGDAESVYLSNDAGEIRYAAPTLRQLSLVVEQATGYDSIPTIERVYSDQYDDSVMACVHPECSYRSRNSELMWKHVHGLIGTKHTNSWKAAI